ncbi:translation initiation factor IF-3 [Pseudarthrobacter sp. AL07]|uniref:translation initiation factor IF-3 n=1 Tax=unclassified Pseudarthrobacter TaxID=2647000 RepID=UPI00249A1265|nr:MULTISPECIES: translation initiation factor IF-3 [unclassified Pseudarthrobacter]MDI3195373.1 translation initiation factor IF-3 [Pseudarthrobacter sp. AL20]MDI3209429.1 translation initiation factor IF-3 [Pseudarthrobacter sp. AL07]
MEYHINHRSFNISEPRINERIRVPEVRLVGPAGEQVGIVRIDDALRLAAESDLDLVEVAPQAKPPVCKLMDFGKYKYEAAVKAREARKNQTNTVLKEIRFRLKIDTHDYETKRGHALRFLGAGDKVKAMIQFRGREQQRPEMGIRLLQRFADDVADVGVVESSPRIDGRNMVMVVGPLKNKAEAKAEARRESQRAEAKAQNEAKATGGGRVDVSGDDQAPLTQSLADLLPEGFAITTVPETEAPAEAETPVAPVEAAPESEAPVKEAPAEEVPVKETAPKEAAPKAAPVKEAAVQEAPKQAAPKAAAPKREAPKAAPAPVKAPAAVKPPEAAAAAPAAPRPPVPMPKPIARPAAPKPAARPAPKAAPKPAGKKTT